MCETVYGIWQKYKFMIQWKLLHCESVLLEIIISQNNCGDFICVEFEQILLTFLELQRKHNIISYVNLEFLPNSKVTPWPECTGNCAQ
jgi:hypothetical protein